MSCQGWNYIANGTPGAVCAKPETSYVVELLDPHAEHMQMSFGEPHTVS